MLEELHVRDLALIEEAWLELGPGMTVLTGETGAGKTVLVGALKLLLGERADATLGPFGGLGGTRRRPLLARGRGARERAAAWARTGGAAAISTARWPRSAPSPSARTAGRPARPARPPAAAAAVEPCPALRPVRGTGVRPTLWRPTAERSRPTRSATAAARSAGGGACATASAACRTCASSSRRSTRSDRAGGEDEELAARLPRHAPRRAAGGSRVRGLPRARRGDRRGGRDRRGGGGAAPGRRGRSDAGRHRRASWARSTCASLTSRIGCGSTARGSSTTRPRSTRPSRAWPRSPR